MIGKNRIKRIILVLLICSSILYVQKQTLAANPDSFFLLIAKTRSDNNGPDYLNLVKQQLARIGIRLDILANNPLFVEPYYSMSDFDIAYIELKQEIFNPYFPELYSENGTYNNLIGYDISLDWDDELETGRNEWYIQNGSVLYPQNSTENLKLNWEWQHYLMDDILPCLPLFIINNDTLSMLVFNLREVRPVLGNRDPCPLYPDKSIGLAVRKAIVYAIDREEINNIVHGGKYEISHWPITLMNSSWCNPNIIKYCHNLQVSRDVMTLSGYDLGVTRICGQKEKKKDIPTWPKWEEVCEEYNTVTIDNSIEFILCSIFTVSLVILYQNKKRIKR